MSCLPGANTSAQRAKERLLQWIPAFCSIGGNSGFAPSCVVDAFA